MIIGSAVLLLAWLARFIFIIFAIRKIRFLETESCPAGFIYPKLSVIIPARNEAAKLENALNSKLGADYPNLEFILINDRSTDSTGKIIDTASAKDSRIRAIHISELPASWLGKVNALNRAVAAASGDWLLFSDADVHFSKEALKKAVCFAEQNRLDHLGVFPEIWSDNFIVSVMLNSMLDISLRWGSWNSDFSRPDTAVGVGAFNLVRRGAFTKTPGFEWLKLEVIDDMGLALMMRRHGFRCAAIHGKGCICLYFLKNFREAVHSCDKGVFAGMDFNYGVVFAGVLAGLAFDVLPFMLLFAGGAAGMTAACTCLIVLLKSAFLSKLNNRPLWPALFFPLSGLLVIYLVLHAAAAVFIAGGVRWRDTFYRLDELKAGKRFRLNNFYY